MTALFPPASRKGMLISHAGATLGTPWQRARDIEYGFTSNVEDFIQTTFQNVIDLTASPNEDIVVGLGYYQGTGLYAWRTDTFAGAFAGAAVASVLPATIQTSSNCALPKVRFSPSGDHVLVPTSSGLHIYKSPEMQLVQSIPSLAVNNACWNHDGTKIAVVCMVTAAAQAIRVYNFPSLTEQTWTKTQNGNQYLQDVAWSPDGRWLAAVHATASTPQEVLIFDMQGTPALVHTRDEATAATGFTLGPNCCVFSPDGLYLYFANQQTLEVVALETSSGTWGKAAVAGAGVYTSAVQQLKFNATKDTLIIMFANGRLILIDWATKQTLWDGTALTSQPTCSCMDYFRFIKEVSNVNGLPVRDVAGNPIMGVNVSLHPQYNTAMGTAIDTAVTDINGKYKMICLTNRTKGVVFAPLADNENWILQSHVIPK